MAEEKEEITLLEDFKEIVATDDNSVSGSF